MAKKLSRAEKAVINRFANVLGHQAAQLYAHKLQQVAESLAPDEAVSFEWLQANVPAIDADMRDA